MDIRASSSAVYAAFILITVSGLCTMPGLLGLPPYWVAGIVQGIVAVPGLFAGNPLQETLAVVAV
jgi:hypothetical protein